MLKRTAFIVALMLSTGIQTATAAGALDKSVYSENFNCSASQLKSKGWVLKGGAHPVEKDTVPCLEVINTRHDKVFPFIRLKVEPGMRYTVSCQVKTENVVPASRGATIFAEWEDKNKKYTPGGIYLKGLKGTRQWTSLKINTTIPAPESVSYMKLYLALEGKGKSWFRNLEVRKCNDWLDWPVLQPADKMVLKNTRPLFSWHNINKKCLLIIARNKELSVGRMVFPIEKTNEFLFPHFLKKGGKWYWRIQEYGKSSNNSYHRSKVGSFTLAGNAVDWPVIIRPEYKWSDSPQPILTAHIAGDKNVKINVKINGTAADNISYKNSLLRFKPRQNLQSGVHDIKFICNNENNASYYTSNIYSNITPGSKVSFKQGIISVNGKPFFPVGTYCDLSYTQNDLEFRGIKEAGFNLVHSYIFEGRKSTLDKASQYLKAAKEHNLKVFMGIRRNWIKTQDNAAMTQYISKIMKFPALLAWYLYDEPANNKVTVSQLKNVYELVKTVDPFHPAYIAFTHVIARKSKLAEMYSECCDIIGSDPYPIMFKKPFTLVELWTQNCRDLAGKERPVWTIIEAFDSAYLKIGSYKPAKHGKITVPSYNQMRCQCFMALSAGADGIIFFWMPMRYYNLKKNAPAVWTAICKIVKELRAIESFMTTPRKFTKFFIKPPKPFRVWIRSNTKGETAVAFINPLAKAQRLKVKLPLGNQKIYFNGQEVKLKNNLYDAGFAPYETKLYILK